MAALIDGKLEGQALEQANRHVSECPSCFDLYVDSGGALVSAGLGVLDEPRAAETSVRRPAVWRSRWAVAAAAGIIVFTGLWLAAPRLRSPDVVQELASAAGTTRPVMGRLSGGLDWAPAAVTRGSDEPQAARSVRSVVIRLEVMAEEKRTAASLRSLGVGKLFEGQWTAAVESLEAAARLEPNSGEIWSDLATAYLARSERGGPDDDVMRALDAVQAAVTRDPNHLEALFNRALVWERLERREEALRAWDAYLARDSQSPWASEGRERREVLAVRPASRRQQREKLLDEHLPTLAQAVLDRGDIVAGLTEAEGLAAAGDSLGEGHFLTETVAAFRRESGRDGSPLLTGHLLYGEARARYRAREYADARGIFASAASALEQGGSPLALMARAYVGSTLYQVGTLAEARQVLESLGEERQLVDRPLVRGYAAWMLGLVEFRSGRYEDALRWHLTAEGNLRRAGADEEARIVEGLLADDYERLGDLPASWARRLSAIQTVEPSIGALLSAGAALRRAGLLQGAIALQGAALSAARAGGRVGDIADGLRSIAITECLAGESQAGIRRLEEARLVLAVSSPAGDRVFAEVDLASAWCGEEGAAVEKGAALRALRYFERVGDAARVVETRRARARIQERSGDREGARRELALALDFVESERARVESGVQRAEFAARGRTVAEELEDLELRGGDEAAAFAAADSARGWDFADLGGRSSGATLAQVQEALGPHATAFYLSVRAQETVCWVIQQRQVTVERLPIGELGLSGRDLSGGWRAREWELNVVATDLTRLVKAHASPGDMLVFVPDGAWHLVPFAALQLVPGRYLVEDHPLLLAPHGASFVDATRRAAARQKALGARLLAVGNPRFDRRRFPGLPELPWAEREARRVAAVYPRSATLLLGADASSANVASALTHADAAHLAVHAVVDRADPSRSALVLAGGGDAGLDAARIGRLTLGELRLAVLAACRTLSGEAVGSRESLSLARAFLRAGVTSVVASLFDLDDRESDALMLEFHREFARSGDAPRALQAAQIAFLRSDAGRAASVTAWAGLAVIGGLPSADTSLSAVESN
jgi:tetratricopeptide (TPR) repeat protein